MRYAILADIHGNIDALDAALADARNRSVDAYIYAGDFYGEFDCPNEVISLIRRTPRAYAIRGNREMYLDGLSREDQSTWTHTQFHMLYWNYREITPDHRRYLMALPDRLVLECPGCPTVTVMHTPSQLFGKSQIDLLSGGGFRTRYQGNPPTHDEYLSHARELIADHPPTRAAVEALPEGVYVFAHYHTQWYLQLGGHLLVNPGSCGVSLDLDPTAAYTILDVTPAGCFVEEYRVPYDIEGALRHYKTSSLYREGGIWAEFTVYQARKAELLQLFFLDFVSELARSRGGDGNPPHDNALWAEASALWRREIPPIS